FLVHGAGRSGAGAALEAGLALFLDVGNHPDGRQDQDDDVEDHADQERAGAEAAEVTDKAIAGVGHGGARNLEAFVNGEGDVVDGGGGEGVEHVDGAVVGGFGCA